MLVVPPGPGVIRQVPSTTGFISPHTLYGSYFSRTRTSSMNMNGVLSNAIKRKIVAFHSEVDVVVPEADFGDPLHESAQAPQSSAEDQATQYSAQAQDLQFSALGSSPRGSKGPQATQSTQSNVHSQAPLVWSRGPPPAGSRTMKTELCFTNIQAGFVIHKLIPVRFQGTKLVRLCNSDDSWMKAWMPYIKSHVKALPWEHLELMNKYWYALEEGVSNDGFWAKRFLQNGVDKGFPVMENYWEQTILAAMPFIEENGVLSLDNLTKAYPRDTIQNCDAFRDGISRAAQKEIFVRFKKDKMQDIVLGEI